MIQCITLYVGLLSLYPISYSIIGRSPGNGISISNATCYLDGRVEYIARVHIVIDGFMVTYNCTVGETTKEV